MKAHADINAARRSYGLAPLDCACPACRDSQLTREDMATTNDFSEAQLQALCERYGQEVCFGCADAHDYCAECNAAIAPHEFRDTDYHGGEARCHDCITPTDRDIAASREDDRFADQREYGE